MQLIIAEKPSVGAAIAAVLGATCRKNGYVEGSNIIVSRCIGHLVGLADAGSYDERFKKSGDMMTFPYYRRNGCILFPPARKNSLPFSKALWNVPKKKP